MAKKYSNKTCKECGVILPQPEMQRVNIKKKTGKSQQGISGVTIAAAALGDEKSHKALSNRVLGTNQREYERNMEVWLCPDCVSTYEGIKQQRKQKNGSIFWTLIKAPFLLIYMVLKIAFISGKIIMVPVWALITLFISKS